MTIFWTVWAIICSVCLLTAIWNAVIIKKTINTSIKDKVECVKATLKDLKEIKNVIKSTYRILKRKRIL